VVARPEPANRGIDEPELIAEFNCWHQTDGEEHKRVERDLVESARGDELLPLDEPAT